MIVTALNEGFLFFMSNYRFGPWLVALAALLWAVDAPFRKYLTSDLPSASIVLMEHLLIAVLVLIFLFRYLGELRKLDWKDWSAVIFIGFGGSALATVFFTQSFHYLNPTVAILLQKLQPLIAIALAALVLKERLTKNFWLWALVAIFGAYLVSFPALTPTGFAFQGNMLGVTLAVLAAVLWGGSTVFGRLVLRKISFQAMTAVRFLSALVFLVFLNLFNDNLTTIANASGRDWLFVFIIAILAGLVSLFIYYKGLQTTKASIATLCELAFPVSAVVVNWIFLEATLSWMQIVGSLILVVAILQLSWVNESEAKEKPVVVSEPTGL
jgi:drug/metabolite transporter (DMT)-like permease